MEGYYDLLICEGTYQKSRRPSFSSDLATDNRVVLSHRNPHTSKSRQTLNLSSQQTHSTVKQTILESMMADVVRNCEGNLGDSHSQTLSVCLPGTSAG